MPTKNTQTYAQLHTCACIFACIQRTRDRAKERGNDTLESSCFKMRHFMKLVVKFMLKTHLI